LPLEPLIDIFFLHSYITSLEENSVEGTNLNFDGALNFVEDSDKVSSEHKGAARVANLVAVKNDLAINSYRTLARGRGGG